MTPSSFNQTEKIPIFNILLGFAVLGALLFNIQSFGITQGSIHQLTVNAHGGNYWLLTKVNILFGSKMAALVSILFGASIVMFFTHSKTFGSISLQDLYIRRQIWLIGFGIVNGVVLLWHNDLLFPFGVVGVLLFPFYRLSPRPLLILAVIFSLIFAGKSFWEFSETKEKFAKYQKVLVYEKKHKIVKPTEKQLADTTAMKKIAKLSDEQKEDTTAWKGMAKMYKFDKKSNASEIKSMRADYATMWSTILPKTQAKEAQWLYRFGIWDMASLMFLGMALFKLGFFNNTFSTKQYATWAAIGFAAGLLLAWLSLGSAELQITDFTKYVSHSSIPLHEVLKPFERAFVAVGWAALIICLSRLSVVSWLWATLAAVGQMALSNYLLQTIFCTLFFFGYGMGYFGELKFYQLYFIVAEIWLIQMVLSVVWLKYYLYGPFEWLWYSLVRWEKQPMKSQGTVGSSLPTNA
jgi:uncharacterized protein